MNRLRFLYLGVPFENEPGGDKNRSRFLWQALRQHGDAEMVLIHGSEAGAREPWTAHPPVAAVRPQPPPFHRSSSIPAFTAADHERFAAVLRDTRPDVIFSRFCTGWELCARACRAPQCPAVAVDVDMISSRLAALSWAADRSFRRRWFLFEKWRLGFFERRLFREPWLFLFTNPVEIADIRNHVAPRQPRGQFALLPNTMPAETRLEVAERKPVILFFGNLDSAANIDAFNFLVDQVAPLLEQELKSRGVEVHVVGKNPPSSVKTRLAGPIGDRIKLVGRVDSMARAIAESLFVLLPLRIASGTRTRILEAAAQRRAVVTTTIGVEGLDLGDTVLVSDAPAGLAAFARRLLASSAEATDLGERLYARAISLYAAEKVAGDLGRTLEAFVGRNRRAG